MELELTEQDLESESKKLFEHIKPEGILNSNYKKLVAKNFNQTNSPSLFTIKQRLRSSQYSFASVSAVGTFLKVFVFAFAIIVIFS